MLVSQEGMRELRFIFGCLVLVSIASALLIISPRPAGLRRSDPRLRVERSMTTLEANPLPSTALQDPNQFPPEHADRCDFSAYHPTRISDWLPAGVLKRTEPAYPAKARLKGIAGTVNVFVLINRQGYVERVCSIGPKELRSSAESAAVDWRFRRPTINEGLDPFGYIQETLVFKFVLDHSLN